MDLCDNVEMQIIPWREGDKNKSPKEMAVSLRQIQLQTMIIVRGRNSLEGIKMGILALRFILELSGLTALRLSDRVPAVDRKVKLKK